MDQTTRAEELEQKPKTNARQQTKPVKNNACLFFITIPPLRFSMILGSNKTLILGHHSHLQFLIRMELNGTSQFQRKSIYIR